MIFDFYNACAVVDDVDDVVDKAPVMQANDDYHDDGTNEIIKALD